jgi:hypothetical protein
VATSRGAVHLERYFAAWQEHDADLVAPLYGEHAVMEDPTLHVPRQGRGEIHRYFVEMFAGLEDPIHDLLDHAERDGRVWFAWTFGSGGRARPLERYRGVSIQTLDAAGLIVRDESYWVPGQG